MKAIFALALVAVSTMAPAATTCVFRFNHALAVTLELDNHMAAPEKGKITWDDMNACGREGQMWICTELYVGAFAVAFKDLTPQAEGEANFKIGRIHPRSDLGRRLSTTPSLRRFIRDVTFSSVVQPDPQVSMKLHGMTYDMDCTTQE